MASWSEVVSDIRSTPDRDAILATTLADLADAPSTTSIVTESLDLLADVLQVATLGQLVTHPDVEGVLERALPGDDRDVFLRALPEAVRGWARGRKPARRRRAAGPSAAAPTPGDVPSGGAALDAWLDHFRIEPRAVGMLRARAETGRVFVFAIVEAADVVRFPHLGAAEGLPRGFLRDAAVAHLREEAEASAARLSARRAYEARRDDPDAPWLAERVARLRRELAAAPPPPPPVAWAPLPSYPDSRVTFQPRPPRLEIDDPLHSFPLRVDLEACRLHATHGASLARQRAEQGAALGCAVDALCDPEGAARRAIEAWLAVPPWKHALRELEEQVAHVSMPGRRPGTGERLAFRLAPSTAALPRIALQSPRRGGGYTAGRLASLVEARSKATPDALEDEILDLMHALMASAPWQLAERPLYTRLLERLGQHPRVTIEGDPTPVRLVRAEPRLVVSSDDDGAHRFEVWLGQHRLDGAVDELGAGGMLVYAPPGAGVFVYALLDRVAQAVLASASRTRDAVPAEAVDGVCRILAAHDRANVAVDLPPALRGDEVAADPRPVARLALATGGAIRFELRVRPFPEAQLQIPGAGQSAVLGTREGARVFAERHLADEAARAARVLEAIGARPAEDGSWSGFVEDPDAACDALVALAELGDEVVVEWQGERLHVAGTATPAAMRVRVEKTRDWFGVQGGVEVGGEAVSLKALLDAMRAGRRFVRLKKGGLLAIGRELRERLARADDLLIAEGGGLAVGAHAVESLGVLVEDEARQLAAVREWVELRARWKAARTFEPGLPAGLAASLRPYQIAGHAWLARLAACGAAACLADDMGLGKTVQALALLVDRAPIGPALVLAPTSVGPNWESETARFAPGLRVVVYRGASRTAKLAELGPGDLLLTSYDILVRDASALAAVRFATLVLDEAHALKNALSKRAQAARDLQADVRVALTGTPLENHLGELWSLFRVLMPMLFGPWERFRARFALPIERDRDPERRAALAALVRPYLLRRTKAEVAPELPPRTEVVRFVELSAEERELYEAERTAALEALAARAKGATGEEARFAVLAALLRLRQLASHPRLRFSDSTVPSSKLASALDLVDELREAGHRALVFSQFTSHLALVAEALAARGVAHFELDGSTPQEVRAERVARFQAGERDVFLISLKAGGVGLNLTGADYVIHLDPWWNPAVEDQASDRAHRIGQDRPVTIVRLIARGTIEEQVLSLHADKRELADAVLAGADASGRLSTADLVALMEGGEAGAPLSPAGPGEAGASAPATSDPGSASSARPRRGTMKR